GVFGEADGVARAGAFVQQLRGHGGETGQLRRVAIGSRTNQRACCDERRIVILGDEDFQAVAERLPRDLREVIRTRGSGRRRRCAKVLAHAASGMNTLVTRFSGTRYLRVALMTSSTFAAR